MARVKIKYNTGRPGSSNTTRMTWRSSRWTSRMRAKRLRLSRILAPGEHPRSAKARRSMISKKIGPSLLTASLTSSSRCQVCGATPESLCSGVNEELTKKSWPELTSATGIDFPLIPLPSKTAQFRPEERTMPYEVLPIPSITLTSSFSPCKF
jgi:hypothetical protein